jgi:HK97 family phage portal protein
LGLRTFYNNVRGLSRLNLFNSEQRSSSFSNGISWNFFDHLERLLGSGNITSDADYPITSNTAMRISTAFTCVLVRGESLSSLPAHVCQYTKNGSRKAYEHAAHYLIHDRPNPFQTASDFWKMVSAQMDLKGQAIAIISWDGRWRPAALNLTEDPGLVEIKIVDGKPYYDLRNIKSDIIEPRIYEHWEVLHFKDLSLDGIHGISKVRYNAETLGYAAKLKAYGSKLLELSRQVTSHQKRHSKLSKISR